MIQIYGQKQWLQQYSAQDLSRTLVRQYLYQHSMFKTLNYFESEDKSNKKKIVKSTVIKMLCINNLVVNNKKLDKDKQAKSLLLILVQYLRTKFQQRIYREENDFESEQHKNKELSLNGDQKILNSQLNRAEDKNIVQTVITQGVFHKKKETLKQGERPDASKNQIKLIAEKKQSRPLTAKPIINQGKEQKVSQIYSKLTENIKENQKESKTFKTSTEENSNPSNLNKIQYMDGKNYIKIGISEKKSNQSSLEDENQNQTKIKLQQINSQQKASDYHQLNFDQTNLLIKCKKPSEEDTKNTQNYQESRLQHKNSIASTQTIYKSQINENNINESIQIQAANFLLPQEDPLKNLVSNEKEVINFEIPLFDPQLKTKINTNQKYQPTSIVTTQFGNKLYRKVGKNLNQEQNRNSQIQDDCQTLPSGLNHNLKAFKPLNDEPEKRQQQKLDKSQIKAELKQIKTQTSKKQQQQKSQQISPQKNVREIKLKKRIKNIQDQQPQTSKFKFNEHFVDQPLYANKQKYSYQKFSFFNIIINTQIKTTLHPIILESNILYTQKPIPLESTNYYGSLKKNEKPLPPIRAEELKKIVFQNGPHHLPKAWHQGFILSPFEETFYGLKQLEGGPCGIIAAMQCYFLKHLMYLSKPTNQNDLKNEIRRECCLVAALTDILWKVKGSKDKIILIIPTNRNFSGQKLQFTSLTEVQLEARTFQSSYKSIWNYKSSFIGQSNHGVLVIIYSIILTKGIQKIYEQVDMKQNSLIGHHGHCTQELVNLFITGQASSNCFDGKKQLEENFTLRGIEEKSEFGFLSAFQTFECIEVGKNLKNPFFPIWIICKEFHYHVIFGNHYLISENNDCAKFDLIYFDGLYACQKLIRLTFDEIEKDEFGLIKQAENIKNLPLIEQVLLKKWGQRKVDWNGSIKIL